MKGLKLGLVALVSVVGIGAAFANTYRPHVQTFVNYKTYFGVTNGSGGFRWTTIKPALPKVCQSGSAYCTASVATTYTPIANTLIPSAKLNPNVPAPTSNRVYK